MSMVARAWPLELQKVDMNMKVFILHAHPEPKSFNGALFRTAQSALAQAGHDVITSDLYAMRFGPVSDRSNFTSVANPDFLKLQIEESHATEHNGFAPEIEAEIAKLEASDLWILQFPLWWFGMPGIMKGWMDRVLAMGRVYGGGRIYENGRYRGRKAMISVTTGGPETAYAKDGLHGDIHGILRPMHRGIFQFLGFDVLAPQVHYGPVRVEESLRKEWLDAYAARLRQIEGEAPIDVGPY